MAQSRAWLPIPRLYIVSGALIATGLGIALTGVLLTVQGDVGVGLIVIGGASGAAGVVVQYRNEVENYSAGSATLAIILGSSLLALGLFALELLRYT